MGKRKSYDSARPKDYWPTLDPDAVEPLIPFVRGKSYAEPCYGDGHLEDQLMGVATCWWRSDVRETVGCSEIQDATTLNKKDLKECDIIITNPPFSWELLKPLLDHLPTLKPTWLLLPADVMHNKRMGPYMENCAWIVSVGRLYWLENKVKGVDNYAWFRFHQSWDDDTRFVGR